MPGKTKQSRKKEGKERKQKFKEEMAESNKYWKKVEAANKLKDPLEGFVSFQSFKKNGVVVCLKCQLKENMDKSLFDWAFQLTKQNMQQLYMDSWGWFDKEKLKEMGDDRMWYLVAFDSTTNEPVAFVSFRFDIDFGNPVVYCYEIQLQTSVQRKGLGKFLMQILQLLAIKHEMHKVVATVLDCNAASQKFFIDKLGYTEDETSPDDECYRILSKYRK